jgi:protein-tyrosine phosphatase
MSENEDELNSFSNMLNESKKKLKPTRTTVYYPNGSIFNVSIRNEQEASTVNSQEKDEASNETHSEYWSRFCGFVVDLFPDYSIDMVVPNLYISGDDVATNREILNHNRITHVINLTTNIPNKFEPSIEYLRIHIFDLPSERIQTHFKDTFDFIDKAISNNGENNVLVHCNAGVSRSSTIVIAYLMQKKIFKTYKEAFEHLKRVRPIVCPNFGFINQLNKLEAELQDQEFSCRIKLIT